MLGVSVLQLFAEYFSSSSKVEKLKKYQRPEKLILLKEKLRCKKPEEILPILQVNLKNNVKNERVLMSIT